MSTALLRHTSRNEFVRLPFEHLAHDEDGLVSETLAAAIARIGSTPAVLLIDSDTDVTGAISWPATLKFLCTDGARLVDAGGTIAFAGNPFVDAQEMGTVPLFEGFASGDITFTGDHPKDVSTEIVYSATNSLTVRLALLTAWFSGEKLTFHCFPRPITSAVTMNDYHSLYFRAGAFTNTYPDGSLSAAITMGSYSRLHSEQGARIHESSVGPSPQIVSTKVGCEDCIIENNYFASSVGAAGDSASANVVIAGSSVNCHIRNNTFDGIAGYHAGIIQTALQDPPENCTITGNTFLNFLTQLAFITSGKHCKINDNKFLLRGATGFSAFSLIDVEPNFDDEVIEDLEICDNYMDLREVTLAGSGGATPLYNSGIILQGVNTAGIKRVKVNRNTIIGTSGTTQTGITGNGIEDLECTDNTFHGVNILYSFEQVNRFTLDGGKSSLTTNGQVYLTACGNGHIFDNVLKYASASVTEAEKRQLAGGNGTDTMQLSHSYSDAGDGRVYDSYIGQVVTFQDIDFTVTDVATDQVFQELTVSGGTVPSVGARNFAPSAINTTTNRITIPLHGWQADQRVQWYSWGSVPGGLTHNQYYYVRVVDANTIELAAAPGGAAVDITSQGGDMHQLGPSVIDASWVNTGTDTINFPNHQMADKAAVLYYTDGDVIGGLTNNTVYYVIRVDANNVKLAATRADAVSATAINLTSQGTGVQGLYPVFYTKFSNNKYRNNTFNTYTLMGTSENYGGYTDSAVVTNEVELGMAVSDETTDLTTGTAKLTFRMPHGMNLTGVRANSNTAPAGSSIIVDINASGSTILSTKLSIDAGEKTSTTAASAAVISDTSLADDEEITVDIDQVGSGTAGKGLKIWLIGERA